MTKLKSSIICENGQNIDKTDQVQSHQYKPIDKSSLHPLKTLNSKDESAIVGKMKIKVSYMKKKQFPDNVVNL